MPERIVKYDSDKNGIISYKEIVDTIDSYFDNDATTITPDDINTMIDYFFDDDDLHFRVLVVPDKSVLDHAAYDQSHDDFYFKMYFDLLKVILDPKNGYNIYLDIKDTRSQLKINHLKDVLRSSHYDYEHNIIRRIQQIRSHEVEIVQLADLLTGAISYVHRGLSSSHAKLALIEKIQKRSGYSLKFSTLYKEDKVNIFIWRSTSVKNAR